MLVFFGDHGWVSWSQQQQHFACLMLNSRASCLLSDCWQLTEGVLGADNGGAEGDAGFIGPGSA